MYQLKHDVIGHILDLETRPYAIPESKELEFQSESEGSALAWDIKSRCTPEVFLG